jgi:RND family efflux transporter MFP subunit
VNVKRIGATLLALLLVAGLVALRARRVREKEQASTIAPSPVVVVVGSVRHGEIQDARRFLGEVAALEETPLGARIVSQVLAVNVREGDRVRRGQALIELDSRELEDAAASSEAAIAAASETVAAAEQAYAAERDAAARDQVLVEARAIPREQWDRSQASLAAAKARLEASRAQLTSARRASDTARTRRGFAIIEAPFDGVVSARSASPGDLAAPGRPLVSVVRNNNLSVRVKVPQEFIGSLRVGGHVQLETPGGPQTAKVSRIFPSMDSARLATIEADLPEGEGVLIPGSTVPVEVPRASAAGLLIPADAMLENRASPVTFVVADGRAHIVPVRVIARTAESAIVSGELRDGDRIVVGRPSRLMLLAEGVPVHISESAASNSRTQDATVVN